MTHSDLDSTRTFFASLMAAASQSTDPRLERIFELVPREAFMGPGPWQIRVGRNYVQTPDGDPRHLYQNFLVALDPLKGIHNGEPFLHARWIGMVAPKSGDHISHIGAGTGYYSAILSMLVLPGGQVEAYEIEPELAASAKRNLVPFENVQLIATDAVTSPLKPSDIIYVNAGVAAPPEQWLQALRPGGRMLFPWCPSEDAGVALLVTRTDAGLRARPTMPVWFIPCVGASGLRAQDGPPTAERMRETRSIYLVSDRAPDDSATAIFDRVWFSSETL